MGRLERCRVIGDIITLGAIVDGIDDPRDEIAELDDVLGIGGQGTHAQHEQAEHSETDKPARHAVHDALLFSGRR